MIYSKPLTDFLKINLHYPCENRTYLVDGVEEWAGECVRHQLVLI